MRVPPSNTTIGYRWWAGGELGVAGGTGTIMSEVTPNAVASMLQSATLDPPPPLTINSERESELMDEARAAAAAGDHKVYSPWKRTWISLS